MHKQVAPMPDAGRLSKATGRRKQLVDRCVKNIQQLDPKMTREKCIEIMEAAIEGRPPTTQPPTNWMNAGGRSTRTRLCRWRMAASATLCAPPWVRHAPICPGYAGRRRRRSNFRGALP
jgi:hypothetical protein